MSHILSLVREIHHEMIDLHRDIHMHPEIGFDVHRTAEIVSRKLNEYGAAMHIGLIINENRN